MSNVNIAKKIQEANQLVIDRISQADPYWVGMAAAKDCIPDMKDGVILINTARGVIINEPDLVDALNSGKVYAAGLDVVCNEPLDHYIPLMDCPNAVITPHIAWAPEETRYRTIRIAAQNFKNWRDGHPTSVVS